MSKPTRDEVQKWLAVTQSGLIDDKYRDVFLKLPNILRAYLTQEEELEETYKHIFSMGQQIARLEAENQTLKAEREKDIQEAINEYRGDLRS